MTTFFVVAGVAIALATLMLLLMWAGSKPRHSQILEPVVVPAVVQPEPVIKHMPIISNVRWPINY